MATHGIKIIDSDLAQDLYAHFMNSFHNGSTTAQLYNQFLNDKNDFATNTPEYEICVTVYALAFWEIGALTEELLNETKAVINQKSTVNWFTQQAGTQAGEAREEELNLFLQKISKPNSKPLKRKRQPKSNLFAIGDVLVFQNPNKTYGTAFILNIEKMSGFSFYSICKTNTATPHQPTMHDFLQSEFYASETPTTDNTGAPTTQLTAWVNQLERTHLEKFSAVFSKLGKISFSLESGQTIITNDFEKFCNQSIYDQEIAYTKSIGMHVDEYKVDEFTQVLEN